MNHTTEDIAARYLAVWNEPDSAERSRAVAALWADDAVELTEQAQWQGHEELEARVAEAYQTFVENGSYTVTSAGDVFGHHDAVTFTSQLTDSDGKVGWAARVFLVIGQDGRIARDYQITVQPLAA
jgi:ketosteroid isomerase-like protein